MPTSSTALLYRFYALYSSFRYVMLDFLISYIFIIYVHAHVFPCVCMLFLEVLFLFLGSACQLFKDFNLLVLSLIFS